MKFSSILTDGTKQALREKGRLIKPHKACDKIAEVVKEEVRKDGDSWGGEGV